MIMADDGRLLNIRIQMEEMITRREGMIAENQWRENRGESQAYSVDDFSRLEIEFAHLRTQL
jgi:hypothetical protein